MNNMPSSGAVELLRRFPEFFFRILGVALLHGLDYFAVLSSNGSFDGTVLRAFFPALTKSLLSTLCGWHDFVIRMKVC